MVLNSLRVLCFVPVPQLSGLVDLHRQSYINLRGGLVKLENLGYPHFYFEALKLLLSISGDGKESESERFGSRYMVVL